MKLAIVVGATREGRVSDKVAKWVALEAKNLSDTEVKIVDLKEHPLPMFEEAMSPQYNPSRSPAPEVKKFLDQLADANAVVLVSPEYNRSYSAVLKNALDHIDFQLQNKPVMLVAHGSTGGAQAVSHLRGVVPGLRAITTPSAVYLIGRAGELIDDDGILNEDLKANPYGPQAALIAALAELKIYSDALTAIAKS